MSIRETINVCLISWYWVWTW